MRGNSTGRVLMWLTTIAASAAAAAAFLCLYRLRDDPIPSLGAIFEFAAFLQPIPYIAAIILAVYLRRRPEILSFTFAAVVGCGAYGWWWLSGLKEVRQIENQPTRRNALGNILPDAEGQVGSVLALLWPLGVIVLIAIATLIGWGAFGRRRRRDKRDFARHDASLSDSKDVDDRRGLA